MENKFKISEGKIITLVKSVSFDFKWISETFFKDKNKKLEKITIINKN
jgi:hypothetical protein